ncbi:MAG TPA: MEDS domain-containing protein, partial [Methanomassiliicoccaceae archaeon]|nr:MEDS domain-containing protein [Methanomassiliicoccaceae archaeon]
MTDSFNDGPYSPAAAGRTISRDHIAFIYTSSEEMLNSTVSLIREGLESGELCLYISDLEDDQIIVQALREGHVDVDEAVEKGRLILSSKHEIYFQRGWFDPDWTIQVIRNLADIAASHGFTSMRMISDMRWTQDRVTGTDRWVDYEAKLSSLDLGVGLKTICQFDSEMLSSDALLSALMTHPRLE